jgi:hypothetical protein
MRRNRLPIPARGYRPGRRRLARIIKALETSASMVYRVRIAREQHVAKEVNKRSSRPQTEP